MVQEHILQYTPVTVWYSTKYFSIMYGTVTYTPVYCTVQYIILNLLLWGTSWGAAMEITLEWELK